MRLRELLENSDASGTGGKTKGKTTVDKSHKDAIPGLKRHKDTGSHYYDMYRMGVHMAGSPGNQDADAALSTGNEFATIAYTDADEEIIKKSAKAMGWKGRPMTSKGSKESSDIHKQSVIPAKKTNKYGV
jgi:hypothetical protein